MLGNATVKVARPQTIDPALEVDVCELANDGLHPVPQGWLVFFRSKPEPPGRLIGAMCVVRLKGNPDAFVVMIRAGRGNTFDLEPWHGPVQPGAAILAAHRVVALQPPP